MKKVLLFGVGLLLLTACSKDRPTDSHDLITANAAALLAKKIATADVVYHYQGQVYPLFYQDGAAPDEANLVQDATFRALEAATQLSAEVTATFSNHPSNHLFLFDNEWASYDFMERDGHYEEARHFKIAFRIRTLRQQLEVQYGQPLDFTNPTLLQDARRGIEALYAELNIITPFPRDVARFLGVQVPQFRGSGGRSHAVLELWEHDDYTGQSMYFEQAPNTTIFDFGDWDCYTMAENPDFTLELRPDGNNWNDCISSGCLEFVQGALAMGQTYFKDSHFSFYSCGVGQQYLYGNNYAPGNKQCDDMEDILWDDILCGHMNDQISSIRLMAVWSNCPIDFTALRYGGR